MDFDWFKTSGAVAGIGGIAIASVAYVFREIIRKEVFPRLSKAQGYKLLNRIISLIFVIGFLGVLAYAVISLRSSESLQKKESSPLTNAPSVPASADPKPANNSQTNVNFPVNQNNTQLPRASPKSTPNRSGIIQEALDRPSSTKQK